MLSGSSDLRGQWLLRIIFKDMLLLLLLLFHDCSGALACWSCRFAAADLQNPTGAKSSLSTLSSSGGNDISIEPPAASQPDCLFHQLQHWKPPLPPCDARRWTAHSAHLAAIWPITLHLVHFFGWGKKALLFSSDDLHFSFRAAFWLSALFHTHWSTTFWRAAHGQHGQHSSPKAVQIICMAVEGAPPLDPLEWMADHTHGRMLATGTLIWLALCLCNAVSGHSWH